MRTLKILLSVLIVLAVMILVGIGYVWKELAFEQNILEQSAPTESGTPPPALRTPTPETNTDQKDETAIEVPAESFTVTPASLPEGQRAVVETLGLDDASITITPAMVECAISRLGAERVGQLKAGETPSIAEGLTLISCTGR